MSRPRKDTRADWNRSPWRLVLTVAVALAVVVGFLLLVTEVGR